MNYKKLIPVMLCFFAMGFVDMVGIASNYVKEDLGLSDSMANILPSLVFLWFLIFSIPTSLLMNKIGRKNTVLLSLVLTLAAMIVPVFTLDFTMLLLSFSLLGIGNAIMQTSLNPLVDSPDLRAVHQEHRLLPGSHHCLLGRHHQCLRLRLAGHLSHLFGRRHTDHPVALRHENQGSVANPL